MDEVKKVGRLGIRVMAMRTIILWTFLLAAGMTCAAAPDTGQPVVEMCGDRTFIYPQRMELSGEETLMDMHWNTVEKC